MCAIANRRRRMGLRLRHVAFDRARRHFTGDHGHERLERLGCQQLSGARVQQPAEQIGAGRRVRGQRQRQRLVHDRDPGLVRLRRIKLWKGRLPPPYYAASGPRSASVTFYAPPATYFGGGRFNYEIGAHNSNGGTYGAGAILSSGWNVGQLSEQQNVGTAPLSSYESWFQISVCVWQLSLLAQRLPAVVLRLRRAQGHRRHRCRH